MLLSKKIANFISTYKFINTLIIKGQSMFPFRSNYDICT